MHAAVLYVLYLLTKKQQTNLQTKKAMAMQLAVLATYRARLTEVLRFCYLPWWRLLFRRLLGVSPQNGELLKYPGP